ncbi:MAG TPA: hypothetical protein VK886_02865 [Vicinamibacterales bacterium]|nr:hypothetical protein [Vicinamibacterales bacterium]
MLIATALLCSGCIVLSMHPAYDDATIAWDETLLGTWRAPEDNVEVSIERGEWRSYRVQYRHPVEVRDFTGHLTMIGDAYFLDLMAPRGVDHGAALVPAHLILRLQRDGARWVVSQLDYDAARATMKSGKPYGPGAVFDQRQYVVLTEPTEALRRWLQARPAVDFGSGTVFERTR